MKKVDSSPPDVLLWRRSLSSGSTMTTTRPSIPSLSLKRILVPVDFSKCSESAVDYAVALAAQFGASLLLLHVVEPFHAGAFAEGGTEHRLHVSRLQESNQALARLAKQKVPPSVRARQYVKMGNAALTITAAARRMNADLIVISTHGHTGVKHLLIGSIAEKIIRHAHCPVLTVRGRR